MGGRCRRPPLVPPTSPPSVLDDLAADSALDVLAGVRAAAGVDEVGPGTAVEHVGAAAGGDRVVARAAHHGQRLVRGTSVAGHRVGPVTEADRHTGEAG